MIDSHYLPDWREDLASIHLDWRVFAQFLPRRTFGVQGENAIKSRDDSWLIMPQSDWNWV